MKAQPMLPAVQTDRERAAELLDELEREVEEAGPERPSDEFIERCMVVLELRGLR